MPVKNLIRRLPKEVRDLARKVRADAVAETNSQSLGGYCGNISRRLLGKLAEIGFSAEFASGDFVVDSEHREPHCWIKSGKLIIDLTATQFSTKKLEFPPIYITHINNRKYSQDREVLTAISNLYLCMASSRTVVLSEEVNVGTLGCVSVRRSSI